MSDMAMERLEQQLRQLTLELAQTQRQVQAVRAASRRGRLTPALGALCGGAALVFAALLSSGPSGASAAAGLTVKAPFKVVGGNGGTILQVDGNGVTYFAGSGGTVTLDTYKGLPYVTVRHGGINGPSVVSLGDSSVGGGGGNLQLAPDSGQQTVGVGLRAYGTTGSITVYAQGAQSRLAEQSGSPMSLLFNGANKNLALGMGIAPQGGQAGSGVITLHGGDGHVLLNLGASSAGGAIAVNNAGGANVANLGVSGTGGALDILGNSSELEAQLAAHAQAGYLAIASGGSAKVEAGATSGGIGVVRAFGPGGFNAIEGRSNN